MIDWVRERATGAARWIVLTVAGGVLIATGLVMLFTPGPGWGLIALGLWLWAKQFRWARRVLDRLADWLHDHRHHLPAFVARRVDEWRRRRLESRAHAERIAAERAARARANAGLGHGAAAADDLVVVVTPPTSDEDSTSDTGTDDPDLVLELQDLDSGHGPASGVTRGGATSGGA